jgi:hypothetical protein
VRQALPWRLLQISDHETRGLSDELFNGLVRELVRVMQNRSMGQRLYRCHAHKDRKLHVDIAKFVTMACEIGPEQRIGFAVAGAGLGLAAVQWLRDSGHRQPSGLVLISPGLDASISRPEQMAIAARDPLQDIPGIREAGRLYAGELDVAHPYVSPLNGDFRALVPMMVFSGTRDLLYPDSVALAAKARAAGVPVELHLRRDQPHNYAGMPTPEGRQARAIILRAVA